MNDSTVQETNSNPPIAEDPIEIPMDRSAIVQAIALVGTIALVMASGFAFVFLG